MENTDIKNIQWFPGHMTKTRRMIQANLSLVDAVAEILDARTPLSSRNPEMDRLTAGKPRIILLNKCDVADEKTTEKWVAYFKKKGFAALPVDCKKGTGLKNFMPVLRNTVLKELVEKLANKGMAGRPLRIMVVGIPNVGKSSFINRFSGKRAANVEDRPGVTRTKQWVKIDETAEMLDMPGVLWPKFEDREVAVKLAFTGAIRDGVLDIETLAMMLLEKLSKLYPDALRDRYKIEIDDGDTGLLLLEKVGRKRGMLVSGGEIDTERAAITVIDEFRGGKLGRISLESPDGV